MTPDSDAESRFVAWYQEYAPPKSPSHFAGFANVTPQMVDRAARIVARDAFLAGRQSLLDDHPAVLRVSAEIAMADALGYQHATYLRRMAGRLESGK